MKVKLLYLFFAFINFLPFSFAKEEPSIKHEKVRLQLKWFHQFQFAGYYAAIEKGFYRDAGIDVELIEGRPGVDFVEQVVSGKAEYGIEMPELIIKRNNGEPVVALAAIFQHSPHILLLRADSGIETPQQLSGKRVMYRKGGSANIIAMLASEGISLDDINSVEHTWNFDDLAEGKVDAVAAYITDQPLYLNNRGIEPKIIKPITYGIDFYGDCLFTSDKHIRKNPKQVKAFMQASLKGWEYAMDNTEEMISLIQDKYAPKKTGAQLRYEAQEMQKLIFPRLVEMGHMNRGRWKHIGDTYVKLGMLDRDYSLDGFIYDPDQKADYHFLWASLGVIGGVFFAGFVGYLLNRHLREMVAKRTTELENSRRRYMAVVEDQTELVCRNLPDCTLTFVNEAYCRYFGKSQEELIGKSFMPSLPEDQRHIIEEGFARVTPDDPILDWEHQNILPSGELAWVRWTNHAIFDDSGNLVEFQGVGRDITEQKIAQDKLLASDQQLRAVNQQLLANEQQLRAANQKLHLTQESVDKAAFEVFWITEYGCFSYVNDMACESLGYSRQELIELSVSDVDPEFDLQIWDDHWQELKSKGTLTFETVHVRKDKSSYPVQVTANYLEHDGVGYNFAYAQDIIKRKRDEKLLQQSERRFKQLFNEMAAGMALHEIICDSNGKPVDYRFLDVNPAFEKLTGLTEEMVVGKTALEVMPGTESEWIEKYGQVALTGESIFFENYSKELSRHYEVVAYCPQKGQFAVIFHDVTDRRKAQIEREELLRTLEAKNSELQSVVYTVSHDLKSPLVNIKGFSGVLCEMADHLEELLDTKIPVEELQAKAKKIMEQELRESVDFIVTSTDKMKLLLDGLLAVSRVGTSEINIEKLDVEERVNQVIKAMQFQLDENNAEVEVGALPACRGDAVQVGSVFTNLIDNALKYRCPDRDCIIRISGKVEGDKSIYCIEDNGIGILDNHQSKIFDLFHRLDPDDGIEGQGIGLTIVKRIMYRQNGNIRVESEPEKGTRFFVELPTA